MMIMVKVEIIKYLLGLLLKIGLEVRIIRTIRQAEIIDSINQVVLNCSVVEGFNTKIRVPNVTKSNRALRAYPKINFL